MNHTPGKRETMMLCQGIFSVYHTRQTLRNVGDEGRITDGSQLFLSFPRAFYRLFTYALIDTNVLHMRIEYTTR